MRLLGEALIFGGAAVALHLALWPGETVEGAEAAGAGGGDLLTVRAASAAIARTVADWDRPPEPAQTTEAAFTPPPPDPPPMSRTPQTALPKPPGPRPHLDAPTAAPALPQIEPPPERTPPPEPEIRPEVAEATPDTPHPAPRPPERKRTEARQNSADKPSVSSAPQVARRAAGDGGGAARGRNAAAESATLSAGKARSLMAEWGGKIRARIARGVPRGAGAGTAIVALTVSGDGSLLGVRLAQSSGNSRIDDLALAAVRRAGRFPAAPQQLGVRTQTFNLPVKSR